MHLFRSTVLVSALLLSLAACAGPQPAAKAARTMSFADKPSVSLDVAEVRITSEYEPAGQGAWVQDSFPVSPVAAVRQWANDRLKATGRDGNVHVIVKEAGIRSVPLQKTAGIKGFFTKDHTEQYEGKITVEVIGKSDERKMSGAADATVQRTVSVPEDASPAQRESIQYEMVKKMMQDLDEKLTQAVQVYLAPFVK
ncbi:MAG: hypothetical protein M3O22_01690 [Pseudomonadota bacterium]|nr:hypothetical protein [Pseudomonadota bacterium]